MFDELKNNVRYSGSLNAYLCRSSHHSNVQETSLCGAWISRRLALFEIFKSEAVINGKTAIVSLFLGPTLGRRIILAETEKKGG
ncbi:MAG: hypothetical protein ACO2PN_11580 [Pyrobaculum sp.]|jgi:hypothetical protein